MSIFLLHHLILAQAQSRPLSKAIIHKNKSVNYQQLADSIFILSQFLIKIGARRSSHVAIYLPKTIETITTFFASSATGAVFIPINPILKTEQVQHILNDCNAQVLITSCNRLKLLTDKLQQCAHIKTIILTDKPSTPLNNKLNNINILYLEDIINNEAKASKPLSQTLKLQQTGIDTDIAAIFYTSGSTGKPKGIMLSHRNLIAGAQSVSQYLNNTSEDKILAVLPFSFDYGFSQLTTAFFAGASVVLMEYLFPKDVIKAVEKYQITGLAAVPSLWIQLASLTWPSPCSLRYFTNSGGTLPVETLNTLQTSLPHSAPYLMYGLTEAFRSTYVPPESISTHKDSIGIAIPNAEVLVLREDGSKCADNEPGELVHRGALVSQGYWNAQKQTARHFKAYTPQNCTHTETVVWSGDIVRRAEDNYLYFISRKDDMIKTSGYRVSPTEIEDIIYQSGIVKEGIALGITHPVLGQAIIVVFTPTDSSLKDLKSETTQLDNYCKKHLPNYMHPSNFFIKSTLPRNQNEKIDRKLLMQEFKDLFQ